MRTLLNRADTHISDPLDKQAEIVHVKSVLKANGYQDWSFKVPNQPDKSKRVEHKQNKEKTTSIPPIGLPYIQGLSEELQRIFGDHGITVFQTFQHHQVHACPSEGQNRKTRQMRRCVPGPLCLLPLYIHWRNGALHGKEV